MSQQGHWTRRNAGPGSSTAALPAAAPGSTGLLRDQSGAIMVIGVFMAILLVGLLFYVAGIGQAVFRRERMQDAADAVALGTAIGHARGMNLIAFINMVMAGLVAIVLALKVIELMLVALMAILAAISWLVPPAAAAIPYVERARGIVHDIHDAARDIVDEILVGLNMAERGIRAISPVTSVGMATVKVREYYADVVDLPIAVPTRLTLPVENDVYNRLCDEAGDILKSLITWGTDGIPFVGKVIGAVADAIIYGVKMAFCYRDGTPPPSVGVNFDQQFPINDAGEKCKSDRENMNPASDNCTQWESELLERHPDADGTCGGRVACEWAAEQARAQCDITKTNAENYSWAEQTYKERAFFDLATWNWRFEPDPGYVDNTFAPKNMTDFASAESALESTTDPRNTNFEEIEANTPRTPGKPCQGSVQINNGSMRPEYEPTWTPWNLDMGSGRGDVKPVCSQKHLAVRSLPEIPPRPANGRLPPGFAPDPDGYLLTYRTVKHVYGCTKPDKLNMKFPEEWLTEQTGDGDDKAPQKMEEGITELGTETFQIRGLALAMAEEKGPSSAMVHEALGRSAFHNRLDNEAWVGLARAAGRIGLSQAEYFFHHNGRGEKKDAGEWLWHMDWRARLVRFRMPGGEEEEGVQEDDVAALETDSLTAGLDTEGLGTDISSVPLPTGSDGSSPSLDDLDRLIAH